MFSKNTLATGECLIIGWGMGTYNLLEQALAVRILHVQRHLVEAVERTGDADAELESGRVVFGLGGGDFGSARGRHCRG